ncbi:helix-turn-helix transcriptional regulator [Mycoplasmatota bacterium WC30]
MIHKVGERISAHRKERNMSQEELGALLNVSRQTISKWETSDTLPDVYNIVALAQLFHLSLDALVLGAQNRYGGSSYMSILKDKRRKTNLLAIIIGSFGSIMFVISIVLSEALEVPRSDMGIIMAMVFPAMMICWAFGIWGFIKVGRINDEIKYLEKLELINLQNNNNQKS